LLVQGVVSDFRGISVFILPQFQPTSLLHQILQDAAYLLHETTSINDNLDESVDDGASKQVEDAPVLPDDDTLGSMDSKKKRNLAKALKQAKSHEQRNKDAVHRQEISSQRKFLYNLIHSNQITKIFEQRSGAIQTLQAPSWETGPAPIQLDEIQEGFSEIANSIANSKKSAIESAAQSLKTVSEK
jgi:hypothetical protein